MKLLKDTWLILEVREEDISTPFEPNQFFNLLLARKIEAAGRIVPPERILLMLTDRSCAYVGSECGDIPSRNILVHPSEWGNAAATAVWLLEIRRWNPRDRILFVPSGSICQPFPELRFALNIAFHSLKRDPAKVFLLQSPLQKEWRSFVAAPVSSLLLLYMNSAPYLLEPLLQHFQKDAAKDLTKGNLVVCPDSPTGDLYEEILLSNPLFLKRLSLAPRLIPGPIHRAAMLGGDEHVARSPTFH